ncbi:MAG: endonuclease Q family protein [Candidatus Margulisiibacteriota bacterium]
MKFAADLHLHSKYSRATSKDMGLESICQWAKWKGLSVVGTGDFTHPLWFSELKKKLKDDGSGLFGYNGIKYMLTTEVCNIFHDKDKLRKIHTMIFAPSFEAAAKINKELGRFADLMSDGRPIFSLHAKKMAEIAFSVSNECVLVPCHIWTPHFSLFGSNNGFDSIGECFGEYCRNIFAAETGLSSDPAMNWRVSALDRIALISNSDAHSPSKLGREANVFDTDLSYKGIISALKAKDPKRFLYTVEFFPEEGKYHYDGHRNCKVCLSPKDTRKKKKKCPQCGKQLTPGVLSRVEELADREEGFKPERSIPFKNLVPLIEIIAEAYDKGTDTAYVRNEYIKALSSGGSELDMLVDRPLEELATFIPPIIVEGIKRVREGKVAISPGYDGQYGEIKIFNAKERSAQKQISLF